MRESNGSMHSIAARSVRFSQPVSARRRSRRQISNIKSDIRVRSMNFKLLAHRDSSDEIEQKTDRTEHERQQQAWNQKQMVNPEGP